MPTLVVKCKDKNILKELRKAEKHLHNAGITFDTGYNVIDAIREWSLDWSLEGAKLTYTDNERKEIHEKNK